MRRLWLLAALLATVIAAECPANTFTCKDGSCIPTDWVGDGEPDCDDGSDEQSSKGSVPKEDDPFDEVVTVAARLPARHDVIPPRPESQPQSRPLPSSGANETEECPYEHQLRVDECSEPVLLFIHEVNAIYFENASFLADKDMFVPLFPFH